MPLISTVLPQQATGEVAQTYQQIQQLFGRLPNALQLFSCSPNLLKQTWQEVSYYGQHSSLNLALLATLRMLISTVNKCDYCIDFNKSLLINMLNWTPEQVQATQADPDQAPLTDKEKALLKLVLIAVNTPHAVTAEDIQALRALGWQEQDILEAVAHGARHVAIDIIFNTFKIEQDF